MSRRWWISVNFNGEIEVCGMYKMKRFLRLAHPGHDVPLLTGAAIAEVARGRVRASVVFMVAMNPKRPKSQSARSHKQQFSKTVN